MGRDRLSDRLRYGALCNCSAVDADDPKTGTILEKRIEEFGLLTKTIVQDTPHKGKHVIFKIPIELNKDLEEQIEFWGKRSLRPGCAKMIV